MENKKIPNKIIITKIVIMIIIGIVLLFLGFKAYEKYVYFYKPYIYINDRAVSKQEYDYYYHSYYNNYLSSYAFALSYMELDLNQDIEPQKYDENRTYGEYFADCAVDQLIKITALNDDGMKNGFEYDYDEEYSEYLSKIEESCKKAKVPLNNYFKKFYGKYATEQNTGRYLKYGFYATAYYDYLCKTMNADESDSKAFDYVSELKKAYEIRY